MRKVTYSDKFSMPELWRAFTIQTQNLQVETRLNIRVESPAEFTIDNSTVYWHD